MHRRFTVAPARFLKWSFPRRSEESLISALRLGDRVAWQSLVDLWSARLYTYLVYSTHSEADAQRLLQAIFSTTLQILLTEREKSNLTTIIVGTAYRHVIDYQIEAGLPYYNEGRWAIERPDAEQSFYHKLLHLPATVRHVLLLRYLVGLTVWELVQATGYSRQMLVNLLYRSSDHFEPLSTV